MEVTELRQVVPVGPVVELLLFHPGDSHARNDGADIKIIFIQTAVPSPVGRFDHPVEAVLDNKGQADEGVDFHADLFIHDPLVDIRIYFFHVDRGLLLQGFPACIPPVFYGNVHQFGIIIIGYQLSVLIDLDQARVEEVLVLFVEIENHPVRAYRFS